MTVRVFYSRGSDYIAEDNDFLITLSDVEFKGMILVFKALSNRSGIQISFDSDINLSITAVHNLIVTLNDILDTGGYESSKNQIEKLNKLARQAQSQNLGLLFLISGRTQESTS